MRATWVCLSVSLPRQCVNYKKPRDDVHTHRVEMGLPSFISRQHNGKGERERKTGVSLFIFGIYQGDVLLLLLVCVCVICIFFRKGRYYWEFETFLSPRAIFLWFRFIFVFRQIPSGRGSCVPFDSFSQPSFPQTLFYLLAPRNKKKSPPP